MSYLNDFLEEERLRLVALPVRLAFYISHIDDVPGTARDDERERLALEKSLRSVPGRNGNAAFIKELADGALANEASWPAWATTALTALDDVPNVLMLVDGRLPTDAGRAYRRMLFYIAGVIAQAACEAGGQDDYRKEVMGGKLITRILDGLSVKTDLKMPQNVSKKEEAALQKLRQSLKG